MNPNDLRGLSDDGLAAHDVAQLSNLTLRKMLAHCEEELASANQQRTDLADRLRTATEDYQRMVKRLQQEVSEGEKLAAGVRVSMLELVAIIRRIALLAEAARQFEDRDRFVIEMGNISLTLQAACDDAEERVQ